MNTTFISASLAHMEPQLVRACALWAGFRIAEHDTPGYSIVAALENSMVTLSTHTASEHSFYVAMFETCPSGIRSAILCQQENDNFRLHAHHALVELAKQQGLHLVNNMLSDLHETQASPLGAAA